MSVEPTVREADHSDVPTLEIVRRQAIEATYADVADRSDYADAVAAPDERLPAWIADPTFVVLVAETPVTPVAFGTVDRAGGELLALFTAPDYRRRGYATAVLDALVAEIPAERDRLLATVPLAVEPVFTALGFTRVGEPTTDAIPTAAMDRPLQ